MGSEIKCTESGDPHHSQDTKCPCPPPPLVPFRPVENNLCHLQPQAVTDSSVPLALPLLEDDIDEIYVDFYAWPLPLSIVVSSRHPRCGQRSALLSRVLLNGLPPPQCTPLLLDGCSGCFRFTVVMNKAAGNFECTSLCERTFSFIFGKCLEMAGSCGWFLCEKPPSRVPK